MNPLPTWSNFKEGLTMRQIYVSFLAVCFVLLTAMPFGMAANYDFKKMTPEIEQAVKNRQARYHRLQDLKQEGLIGENNKGYVANLKDDAAAGALVTAENKDRRVLYEALAEQNMLGSAGLLEVQRAFAEVQSEKAGPGDMVQSPEGNWAKKA